MTKKSGKDSQQKIPSGVTAEKVIEAGISGVAGDHSPELLPLFNSLKNEKVSFNLDSYIVLGRDRNSSDISGYGGAGHTKSHSIDIVTGRGSGNIKLEKHVKDLSAATGGKETVYIDPDFKYDAARIYLSQKSNIDEYFNLNSPLGNGVVGESIAESAIGIKADSVRVVSRKGVKIVANSDGIDSKGFKIKERKGVDLISMPENISSELDLTKDILRDLKNNMQPIPKGDNLALALEDLARQLDVLSGLFINFVDIQSKYNNIVATHTHISPFYAITVPPSLDLIPANIELNITVFAETIADTLEFKMAYLNKFKNDYLSSTSDTYINSRYHHLN